MSVKEEIVDAATLVFRRSGFHGASIQDIAKAANVPKGSVYNHFSSKTQLAAEVVTRYAAGTPVAALATEAPALERLREHLNDVIARTSHSGIEYGCLLGNMAAESGEEELNDLRFVVEKSFDTWTATVADTIRTAQEQGEIHTSMEATALAGLIIDALEGATLRAKALRSTRPLDVFVDAVFTNLLI